VSKPWDARDKLALHMYIFRVCSKSCKKYVPLCTMYLHNSLIHFFNVKITVQIYIKTSQTLGAYINQTKRLFIASVLIGIGLQSEMWLIKFCVGLIISCHEALVSYFIYTSNSWTVTPSVKKSLDFLQAGDNFIGLH
jgi:hypothetical protein